jgi:hypothetical protein
MVASKKFWFKQNMDDEIGLDLLHFALVSLKAGVNFTNILRAAFAPNFSRQNSINLKRKRKLVE